MKRRRDGGLYGIRKIWFDTFVPWEGVASDIENIFYNDYLNFI